MPHSPPMARSLARYLRRRAPLAYRGLPVGRFSIGTPPRWLFSRATPPAHRRKRKQRMCELLRADGADGTGGRTCTFILRFWRPLLCLKLRLQKSAGLSRLSAVIKNRRIRYGRNRCRRLPNSRQHKSRKAVSRSLRLLTVSLYHFYRGLSRVNLNPIYIEFYSYCTNYTEYVALAGDGQLRYTASHVECLRTT